MKRRVLMLLVCVLLIGCSVNDALTKVCRNYDAAIDKIRATVGDENIKAALQLYEDGEAADLIIEQYEVVSGETLSDRNRVILKIPLQAALAKLRKDLLE